MPSPEIMKAELERLLHEGTKAATSMRPAELEHAMDELEHWGAKLEVAGLPATELASCRGRIDGFRELIRFLEGALKDALDEAQGGPVGYLGIVKRGPYKGEAGRSLITSSYA